MVKFLLRKTRPLFPSLVVIITIITIMALKHSHLGERTTNISLNDRILYMLEYGGGRGEGYSA